MIPSIIQTLMDDFPSWVITGSRFFNNAKEGSDWDFLCQYPLRYSDREQILERGFFLEKIFFKKEGFGGVLEIWSLKKKNEEEEDIHLLVVDDLEKRIEIQFLIKTFFHKGYLNKEYHAKSIFEMAETIWEMKKDLEKIKSILEKKTKS